MAENNELQEVLTHEGLAHLWAGIKPKIADAKKAGTDAQAEVGTHNTDTAAHNDLRLELKRVHLLKAKHLQALAECPPRTE